MPLLYRRIWIELSPYIIIFPFVKPLNRNFKDYKVWNLVKIQDITRGGRKPNLPFFGSMRVGSMWRM